jgi:hypothetical protein
MIGPIILIAKSNKESEILSHWTINWLKENNVAIEPTVYLCSSLEQAEKSISAPLKRANPPSFIILDHDLDANLMVPFAFKLRQTLPETWILELLRDQNKVPVHKDSFILPKPFAQKEWVEILSHLFSTATTPQWSRAIAASNI